MTKQSNSSLMRNLVRIFQVCGQSQKEFAEAHGLNAGKLYYWVSKLSGPRQSAATLLASKKDFVAISVTPEPEGHNIVIRCKSGVEIEIP